MAILIEQMIATARHTQKVQQSNSQSKVEDYWTMLILSPTGFFTSSTGQKSAIDLGMVEKEASVHTAELSIVVHALRKVEMRWTQFNEYIGSLLVEDFMDPKAYTMLLFDDETFSRSRLYFWIIGCLNEFDTSIADNIKQLKLFRQTRIRDVSNSESQPAEGSLRLRFQTLKKETEEIQQNLEGLQAQFRAKLATVQALRDGVSSFAPAGCYHPKLTLTLYLAFQCQCSY